MAAAAQGPSSEGAAGGRAGRRPPHRTRCPRPERDPRGSARLPAPRGWSLVCARARGRPDGGWAAAGKEGTAEIVAEKVLRNRYSSRGGAGAGREWAAGRRPASDWPSACGGRGDGWCAAGARVERAWRRGPERSARQGSPWRSEDSARQTPPPPGEVSRRSGRGSAHGRPGVGFLHVSLKGSLSGHRDSEMLRLLIHITCWQCVKSTNKTESLPLRRVHSTQRQVLSTGNK
ncbi:uncharacterized protein LOC104001577 [Pan troglodytes]|uniref:uncharacterized protein LOC104001577 n=1 Tax=Pan troglodytes TaxID=9598 RepID=UPI0030137155